MKFGTPTGDEYTLNLETNDLCESPIRKYFDGVKFRGYVRY